MLTSVLGRRRLTHCGDSCLVRSSFVKVSDIHARTGLPLTTVAWSIVVFLVSFGRPLFKVSDVHVRTGRWSRRTSGCFVCLSRYVAK